MILKQNKNTALPLAPKIDKDELRRKKRRWHQELLKDIKNNELNLSGAQNKDMDLGNDKKDELNEFTKWYDELFGGGWEKKRLSEDSVNFPGVYPGTAFASLKKMAVADLKIELLKALSRAQDLGMVKDYKNAIIEINGKQYTYDTLPKSLVEQAIKYINDKLYGTKDQEEFTQDQNGSEPVKQFLDYLKSIPELGSKSLETKAARSFPLTPIMPGEDTTDMPEQTDNNPAVEETPVYKKQIKPMKQYEGSYPWIEKDNPYWDYMKNVLYDTFYFFGI